MKTVSRSLVLYCTETWSLRKEDTGYKKNSGSGNVDMEKDRTHVLDRKDNKRRGLEESERENDHG